MVNDISGFTFDSDLPETCRKAGCAVVLMHTSRHPEDLSWSHDTASGTTDILARVMHSLRASVATAQTHRIESIVVDPGFGFGKSVEENFRLLGRLDRLHEIGYPVLAGVSRKSFLGHAISRSEGAAIAPPSERLAATLAAQTIALQHGADILRVHDVEAAVHLRAIVQAVGSASR
jgi:dihydropteroate synthase